MIFGKEEQPLVLGEDLDFPSYQTALAGSAAAAHAAGISLEEIAEALQGFDGFSGRMKVLRSKGLTIFDSSNSGLKVGDVRLALDRARGGRLGIVVGEESETVCEGMNIPALVDLLRQRQAEIELLILVGERLGPWTEELKAVTAQDLASGFELARAKASSAGLDRLLLCVPVAVVIGADPATILGAVTPVPDSLSEYQFAGLLRGSKTELVKCLGSDLQVPASAEIVLEGAIHPGETALEGPYGDHTGYYNEQDRFPVFTIERITMRRDPIYHSTYTGKPPDEPAMLGVALNEVFVPLLQKQFPEIADFYLPPEGCSYRMAVVSIKKQYPGHAKRVMFGIWSFLRQFMYTKFIIVVDDDIDVRNWKEVIWAITTRVDPVRDTLLVDKTPIDYLDFASPVSGLGGKMGLDATNKWPGETQREWGTPIVMDEAVKAKVDAMWGELGL